MEMAVIEWFEDQVRQFTAVRPRYLKLAEEVTDIFAQAVKLLGVNAIVQARVKKVPSFAEKILRKREKYHDPVRQLTDLCGVRVIAQTKRDAELVSRFIREHFAIDLANSEDVLERLQTAEFGYRSVHYVVQLKRGEFSTASIRVSPPDEAFPDLGDPSQAHPMKVEVQVRTIAQHAWADIGHDRIYKSGFDVPKAWRRESARIAAVLEDADEAFERLVKAVDAYSIGRRVAIKREQLHDETEQHRKRLRAEIEILQAVGRYHVDDEQHVLRIAQLATCLEDWPLVIEMLQPFADGSNPAILNSLGFALCELYKHERTSSEYLRGRGCFERAIAIDSGHVESAINLAQSWADINDGKALEHFEAAFRLAPTDPRALAGYLRLKLVDERNLGLVLLLRHTLEEANAHCRDFAEAGVFLPEAWYCSAEFQLLLGRPYDALAAYIQAIMLSTAEFMLDGPLQGLRKLRTLRDAPPEFQWAETLLLLAKAVRFGNATSLNELRGRATPNSSSIQGPVVIVAGGCDASVQTQLETYRGLLEWAFQDFHGTILSGGTVAGISGLVGELTAASGGRLRSIAWLPRSIPAHVNRDPRYSEIRFTSGKDFTAAESLQSWVDLLTSGLAASEVKLLGINGGTISGFEYQLAAMLGAKVGVIRDSGREASKLSREPFSGVVLLPNDRMTVKLFVEPPPTSTLAPKARERLAEEIHERYRAQRQAAAPVVSDPATQEWLRLTDSLKESNRNQADQIDYKLRMIGLRAVEVTDREIQVTQFTPEQVEFLAELEHGRFVAERLLSGWTPGPRDPDKKRSPYLVPWHELSEPIKDYDREPVRAIPSLLAKLGLEIRRIDV